MLQQAHDFNDLRLTEELNHEPPIYTYVFTTPLGDVRIAKYMLMRPDGATEADFISGLEKYPENELVVFHEEGHEVSRQKLYLNEWNARTKSGEELEDGRYLFALDLGNGEKALRGYFYILRHTNE